MNELELKAFAHLIARYIDVPFTSRLDRNKIIWIVYKTKCDKKKLFHLVMDIIEEEMPALAKEEATRDIVTYEIGLYGYV